jgi:diacylglycerol kinase (ATP)
VDRRPDRGRHAAACRLEPAPAGIPPRRPRRILVILNPVAGRPRRAWRRWRRTLAELKRRGCAVTVRRTAGAGDAERLAGAAEPVFDLVVAAGGDGTVSEVVNGLAGSPRPLGILPLGSANVLAHELGLPRRPKRLAAMLAGAPAQPIWPGRLGDRLFVCMAGIGFDAAVVGRVDADRKRRFGKLAFLWAILESLARYRPRAFTIGIDGAEYRAGAAVIAKTRFYAGRFVIAPGARAADPFFHVVMFPPVSRPAVLCYLAAMALGLLPRMPGVSIVPGRTVSLPAPEKWPLHADGEIIAERPASVTIAAKPLLILSPAR